MQGATSEQNQDEAEKKPGKRPGTPCCSRRRGHFRGGHFRDPSLGDCGENDHKTSSKCLQDDCSGPAIILLRHKKEPIEITEELSPQWALLSQRLCYASSWLSILDIIPEAGEIDKETHRVRHWLLPVGALVVPFAFFGHAVLVSGSAPAHPEPTYIACGQLPMCQCPCANSTHREGWKMRIFLWPIAHFHHVRTFFQHFE